MTAPEPTEDERRILRENYWRDRGLDTAADDWADTRAEARRDRHVSPRDGDVAAGVYEESLERWTA